MIKQKKTQRSNKKKTQRPKDQTKKDPKIKQKKPSSGGCCRDQVQTQGVQSAERRRGRKC